MLKDGLRKVVVLPTDFGVPLHAQDELFRPRGDYSFAYAVGCPCNGFKVAAHDVNGLMVMAVDGCVGRSGEFGYERILSDVDRMRAPPEQIALHVLKWLFDFRRY